MKPIWVLLKQQTVSGSGISWAICKPAPRSRHNHASTPPLSFYGPDYPYCRPTNSVKALKKANKIKYTEAILLNRKRNCYALKLAKC